MELYRQGDVLFKKIKALPEGTRIKRENATVAYGENTGHSHSLAVADHDIAEVLEIGDGLFVHVSSDGIRLEGARFVHEEHSTISLPNGAYEVVIQREYSPT